MRIPFLVVSLLLVVGAWAAALQNQQSAPPLKDQSAYPSATHKMTAAEKSNTPEAHGQPLAVERLIFPFQAPQQEFGVAAHGRDRCA